MKRTLIILNIASLLGALIWLMLEQSWEPLVTSIGLVGSLITIIFSMKNSQYSVRMTQKGGKNSKNYQAANDMTIINKE